MMRLLRQTFAAALCAAAATGCTRTMHAPASQVAPGRYVRIELTPARTLWLVGRRGDSTAVHGVRAVAGVLLNRQGDTLTLAVATHRTEGGRWVGMPLESVTTRLTTGPGWWAQEVRYAPRRTGALALGAVSAYGALILLFWLALRGEKT